MVVRQTPAGLEWWRVCISDRPQVVLKLLGSCRHFESHWTTEQFKKAVKDPERLSGATAARLCLKQAQRLWVRATWKHMRQWAITLTVMTSVLPKF